MNRVEFIEKLYHEPIRELSKEERKDIIDLSVKAVDPTIKQVVVMEELAELSQQISKQIREEGDKCDLLEEMADVYICLEFIKKIHNIDEDIMNKAIDIKLLREKKRREPDDGER